MRKIIINLALSIGLVWPALASDNALVFTPGSGVTERSRDVGSGVQSPIGITDQITTPSANFTRPANTTAYASGQLVANSTTAGSVTPLSWSAGAYSGAPVYIRRALMQWNTNGVTSPNFRLHLYTSSPTVTNGDGGTYLSSLSGHFCDIDVNMYTTTIFSANNDGIGTPNNGSECNVIPTSQTIYGLVEARGPYAPGNAAVLTVQLEVHQP